MMVYMEKPSSLSRQRSVYISAVFHRAYSPPPSVSGRLARPCCASLAAYSTFSTSRMRRGTSSTLAARNSAASAVVCTSKVRSDTR